jgi:hypothetical protein
MFGGLERMRDEAIVTQLKTLSSISLDELREVTRVDCVSCRDSNLIR